MNAMSVRRAVYQSVIAMDLVWFDLHLGAGEQRAVADSPDGPIGAGGLMAKFSRFVLYICFSFILSQLFLVKQIMLEWPLH